MRPQTAWRQPSCCRSPQISCRAATGPVVNAAAAASSVLLPPETLRTARLLYATSGAPAHTYPGHPECAERVPAILTALETSGLTPYERPEELVQLEGFSAAPLEAVLAVHVGKYAEQLEKLSQRAAESGTAMHVEQETTYLTGSTYGDAMRAAGAVLALVDNVVAASRQREAEAASSSSSGSSSSPAAFAICRPPGHHCLPGGPMGFCIFGNAAIAARHAQRVHGLQRVLVYDFDVHHGNGTQAVFENDPDVLFISSHQSGSYPNTGKIGEVGTGAGEGATINVPLPGDSGHTAALDVFETIVAPAAQRFKPDIILVSAGYDAHWRDPLAGLQFRTSTYHALGACLKQLADQLCGGRIVFLLEGGYDLKALGESVANTFLGVLGEGPADAFNPDLLRDEPTEKVQQVLLEARRIHDL
ncbi:histone deacetylase 14 isoform X1 [Chlorella sorokiniana]|uniref:Histone deacetylase 14 isoform X1 n=1 Tax=Chlorella sorokiniana TaxID=3076 RepID=A0A2P6TPR2_CHLSO|nr:histone deacetylase 14 isoform X1 [Chlorella sorokiniana]|eukprot:PRW56020.1 histone deacetylase 14 isoform X1 [Chlorella sorokiniana]